MGLISRAFKFTLGAAAGAGVGATVALLIAPESGQDLQRKLRERIREAKAAGAAAQARTEAELVRKFRAEVNDPTALSDVEAAAMTELEQAALAAGTTARTASVASPPAKS